MMKRNEYIIQAHMFCTINVRREAGEGYGRADRARVVPEEFAIILHVGDRVWVEASYADDIEGSVQVGDGLTNGFSRDGQRILSVPESAILHYWDCEEYDQICRARDADERLLSYAL